MVPPHRRHSHPAITVAFVFAFAFLVVIPEGDLLFVGVAAAFTGNANSTATKALAR
jgi:hypothetical protein